MSGGADNSKLIGCIGMDLEHYPILKSNGTIKRVHIIDYQFTEGWTMEVNGREGKYDHRINNEE